MRNRFAPACECCWVKSCWKCGGVEINMTGVADNGCGGSSCTDLNTIFDPRAVVGRTEDSEPPFCRLSSTVGSGTAGCADPVHWTYVHGDFNIGFPTPDIRTMLYFRPIHAGEGIFGFYAVIAGTEYGNQADVLPAMHALCRGETVNFPLIFDGSGLCDYSGANVDVTYML